MAEENISQAPPLPQRRRHNRVQAPLARACAAEFIFLGRRRQFIIEDVSVSGIGMRGSPRDAAGLVIGMRLGSVSLDLGQRERLVVDLEVRTLREMRTFLLGPQVICGCACVGLSAESAAVLEAALRNLSGQ